MKYDVFISYSTIDQEIADEICNALTENGIEYFIYKKNISGGEEYKKVIVKAIYNSYVFLFLGSDNFYKSKETNYELDCALDCYYDNKDRMSIIPYRIDDEPIPKDFEVGIKRFNIRNIREHPIKECLIPDIQTALKRIKPQGVDEDPIMVNKVLDAIVSSSYDKQYIIRLLIALGDFNWPDGLSNRRAPMRSNGRQSPNVAKVFYKAALKLLSETSEKQEFDEDRNVALLYMDIGDIEKELGNLDEAEVDYSQAEQRLLLLKDKRRTRRRVVYQDYLRCLYNLTSIRFSLKKFDLVEDGCLKAKDCLFSFSSDLFPHTEVESALKFCELLVDVHKEKADGTDTGEVYDEFLSLFRKKESLSDALYDFAQSAMRYEDWGKAEEYLIEASSLSKEDYDTMRILMDLARTYEAQDKRTETLQTYDRCFKLMLKKPASSWYPRQIEDVVDNTTRFYDSCHLYSDVEVYYQIAIAKFLVESFGETSGDPLYSLYVKYADWLYAQKRYSDALDKLNACERFVPQPTNLMSSKLQEDRIRIAWKRSRILNGIGLVNDALSCIESALESVKESFETEGNVTILYKLSKNLHSIHFDAAESLVKQFIIDNLVPVKFDDIVKQVAYDTELGCVLMLLREYDYARGPLEEASKLAKEDEAKANAKSNLGRLYVHIGKYKEADKLISEVCAYYAGLPEKDVNKTYGMAKSQSHKGFLMLSQGDYEVAVILLEKALALYEEYVKRPSHKYVDAYIEQTAQWLGQAKAKL